MIPMPRRNSVEDEAAIAVSARVRETLMLSARVGEIGELGRVVGGSTPATDEPSNWGGDIVWITPKDLGRPRSVEVADSERTITETAWPNLTEKLLPVGTVLFSSRAPIGHVGIAAVPLCTNQGFKNLICSDELNPRFAFHMLRGSVREIEAQGRGNTFSEVPAKVIKQVRAPVPAIDVQVAVASSLDSFYASLTGRGGEFDESEFSPLGEDARFAALAREVVALHHLHERIGNRLADLLPALLVG